METSSINFISPIDGRYSSQTIGLRNYFSEYGLIKYRVLVETRYLKALIELPLPELSESNIIEKLDSIYENFSLNDAVEIKEIEKSTNHDVKAVEYFLKEKLNEVENQSYKEFFHFALTSQDINNTAIPLLLKEFMEHEYHPLINELKDHLSHMTRLWNQIPMLARTHGQPASPTTVGKEINVFGQRISNQLDLLVQIPFSAKFGGATGNMNAHYASYPAIDWKVFANNFVESLGLVRSYPTTQIEHYDNLAALFDNVKRINTILLDMARDFWQYISLNYFKQKINAQEVGSSAMPHKINPIDFENAEGNLGLANAIFEHLSSKLPVSRLQRDLSDSTVLRNIGVPFAHTVVAIKSLLKGLQKLELNKTALDEDLNQNWVVIAEGIQNILRRAGYPKPFEALKELTRNNSKIDAESMSNFIDELDVSEEVREELKALTPFNYIGKTD